MHVSLKKLFSKNMDIRCKFDQIFDCVYSLRLQLTFTVYVYSLRLQFIFKVYVFSLRLQFTFTVYVYSLRLQFTFTV